MKVQLEKTFPMPASADTAWGAPASMHIANGATDVGPGSVEALLAMSPSTR